MPSTASAPTIRNAGMKPATPRKLFVNIPVEDLQRSVDFFEAVGFTFNTQFTDETATCMLVGEDAYFMLLTKDKFSDFSKRPVGDPHKETRAMFAISCESREAVDAIVRKAVAAGGSVVGEPADLDFMYSATFADVDGYRWEPFWMDPKTVNG
jgi:predicted lactoylglutathione lyase